ncbi:MAG: transferrin receptor-like dimerization domain-containing protein, partial [Terriglobia bacterium]
LKDVKVLTKIPVLPLSYGDAQPLLAALGGRVAPAAWRGALPITYHIGPGPARVNLKLTSNWDVRPIYDVIARIPGSSEGDEWVIRGNHHDGWVNGSADPISGLTGMLEGARALGELVKEGWKPRRTIIYCAWDAEEEGLIGSTEWAEEHTAELRQHAVAYINSDMNMRGYLGASGSPTLQKFVNGVAADITDPEKHISVEQRLRLRLIARASSQGERDELRRGGELKLGVLGSGSDYSAFLDHVGIPTLVLSFGGEGSGGAGIYHSIYDDFYWYSHFGDPTFEYGRALAQMDGTAMMRLANAPLLPIDFEDLARAVRSYVKDAQSVVRSGRSEAREHDLQISEGVFRATADPDEHLPSPVLRPSPPYLNFASLSNAAARLAKAASDYHKLVAQAEAEGGAALDRDSMARVNDVLRRSEQALAMQGGLPGRPWYKNSLYGPGIFTGYDARTLPAVRQEIALKNWQQANAAIQKTAAAIDQETQLIHEASQALEQALK